MRRKKSPLGPNCKSLPLRLPCICSGKLRPSPSLRSIRPIGMLYLKLGDDKIMQTSVSDDQKTAVAYYRKADEFAAASGMPDQEAHTGYKLALSLMHIGSYTEAIEKFKKYRDKCYEIRDYEGKIQH